MANEPYIAPCRESHGYHQIEDYAVPWTGKWFSPREAVTVFREHDPRGKGPNALVLQPGDLVEEMGRAFDIIGYWWDMLWVRTGPHEGTCVYTERSTPDADPNTPFPLGFEQVTA